MDHTPQLVGYSIKYLDDDPNSFDQLAETSSTDFLPPGSHLDSNNHVIDDSLIDIKDEMVEEEIVEYEEYPEDDYQDPGEDFQYFQGVEGDFNDSERNFMDGEGHELLEERLQYKKEDGENSEGSDGHHQGVSQHPGRNFRSGKTSQHSASNFDHPTSSHGPQNNSNSPEVPQNRKRPRKEPLELKDIPKRQKRAVRFKRPRYANRKPEEVKYLPDSKDPPESSVIDPIPKRIENFIKLADNHYVLKKVTTEQSTGDFIQRHVKIFKIVKAEGTQEHSSASPQPVDNSFLLDLPLPMKTSRRKEKNLPETSVNPLKIQPSASIPPELSKILKVNEILQQRGLDLKRQILAKRKSLLATQDEKNVKINIAQASTITKEEFERMQKIKKIS